MKGKVFFWLIICLAMPARGSELLADSQGKTAVLENGGATGGAVGDDLEQIAADLRDRLTSEECRRLAELLGPSGDSR